jgi:hypothetical protein
MTVALDDLVLIGLMPAQPRAHLLRYPAARLRLPTAPLLADRHSARASPGGVGIASQLIDPPASFRPNVIGSA